MYARWACTPNTFLATQFCVQMHKKTHSAGVVPTDFCCSWRPHRPSPPRSRQRTSRTTLAPRHKKHWCLNFTSFFELADQRIQRVLFCTPTRLQLGGSRAPSGTQRHARAPVPGIRRTNYLGMFRPESRSGTSYLTTLLCLWPCDHL